MHMRRLIILVTLLGVLLSVGTGVFSQMSTTSTPASDSATTNVDTLAQPVSEAVAQTASPTLVLRAPAGAQPLTGTVNVELAVTGAAQLEAFEVDIQYNPALVQLTGMTLGSFLGQPASCASATARCAVALGPRAATNGKSIGAYSYGAGPAATGDGTLAVLHFQPVGVAGSAVLHLVNAGISASTANLAAPATQDATLIFAAPTPTATNTPTATSTPTATPTALPGGLLTQDLTTGLTAATLASSLLGDGVSISNVTYTGTQTSGGRFSGGTGIIGFEQGVVLSSGRIASVKGPNLQDGLTTNNGSAGDTQLTALAGQQTFDATVLEFDFVPNGDKVFFQYVFGSDEYNEYVGSINDIFAFFVNGTNCATVNGSTVVAINTINKGSNPSLYRNNDLTDGPALINTEMDGLTVVLDCAASVRPNEINHIKLAVADAADSILDSAVFLRAGSFSTTPPEICGNGIDDDGDGLIDEGCVGPTATSTPTQVPPTATPLPPTATPTPQPVTCELYPFALHTTSLKGIQPGDTVGNIWNGTQPGNFGWLTWAGNTSDSTLATSLTVPGNSATYTNPFEPNDKLISVGDYVRGRPGVNNSSEVRAALDKLKDRDIVVPAWSTTRENGNNTLYGVSTFARLRILDYSLVGQDRFITARFLGYTACGK